jgi:hypothetical protein
MRLYPRSILALSLLILLFLFSACSHVLYSQGSINTNKVISVVNGQTESKLTLIAIRGSDKFFADFKQWSDFFVTQLTTELEKRGVRTNPQGDYTFTVSVSNLRLFWGAWAVRCIVDVHVARSDGAWAKTYEGNNAGHNIDRAIDGAIHKAVALIIGDPEFQKVLSE